MEIIVLLVLLIFGYFFGQRAEKKHFKSIIAREKTSLHVPVVTMKAPPAIHHHELNAQLVAGNAVISIDFFKKFVASLKMLFGGRVTQYEALLDRARREAILRMKEQAALSNAFVVLNARVETASISKNSKRRNSVGAVEVLAYGTAISLGQSISNKIEQKI
ncbi:MAG: YbjQ family protein [Gammaproteobacteria bacterium]